MELWIRRLFRIGWEKYRGQNQTDAIVAEISTKSQKEKEWSWGNHKGPPVTKSAARREVEIYSHGSRISQKPIYELSSKPFEVHVPLIVKSKLSTVFAWVLLKEYF